MTVLDFPLRAASGRRLHVGLLAGAGGLGALSGFGLLADFEIFVFTSLVVLAVLQARHGPVAVAIWGGAYVATTGIWLWPAANGALEIVMLGAGLPILGAGFYGGAVWALSSVARLPLLASFPIGLALAELVAAIWGFSLAPIGLALIGSGGEWVVGGLGVYGGTLIMALIAAGLARYRERGLWAAHVLALIAIIVPPLERPEYVGPSYTAAATHPDPFEKWDPAHAKARFVELVTQSGVSEADLTIWPENSVLTTLRVDVAVAEIPDTALPVLFGMKMIDPTTGDLKNGAIYVDANRDVQITSKEQLVPVIESGPAWLGRSGLTEGTRSRIDLGQGTSILALICYENAFGMFRRSNVDDVSAIFVLAAETGFWDSVGSALMDRHIRARELETGLPVIKVSDVLQEPGI